VLEHRRLAKVKNKGLAPCRRVSRACRIKNAWDLVSDVQHFAVGNAGPTPTTPAAMPVTFTKKEVCVHSLIHKYLCNSIKTCLV
jgi:hypothetical protein